MPNEIKHLSLEHALTLVPDPQTARIAEFLWVTAWNNDPKAYCEWTSNGDGQWNACVNDAEKLSDLFNQMLSERGSS